MTDRDTYVSVGPGERLIVTGAVPVAPSLSDMEAGEEQTAGAKAHLRRFGTTHFTELNHLRGGGPDSAPLLLLGNEQEVVTLVTELRTAGMLGTTEVIDTMRSYLLGTGQISDMEAFEFSATYAGFLDGVAMDMDVRSAAVAEADPKSSD